MNNEDSGCTGALEIIFTIFILLPLCSVYLYALYHVGIECKNGSDKACAAQYSVLTWAQQ